MDKLKKDAHSEKVNNIIQKEIDYSLTKSSQMGTPALQMGDDYELGIKGYHDLKKWAIDHGAKPKHLF